MKFRYREGGPSGFGSGRRAYMADDKQTFQFQCMVEGVPGDWRIRFPLRRFLGPFKNRDTAVDEYLRLTGPDMGDELAHVLQASIGDG